MNRVAMIAAVVGLSAAPAFAATQSNNAQPAVSSSVQQSTANHTNQPNQRQIDQRQAQLDRQQERLDQQQAALDQQQMQRGSEQNAQQAQNHSNTGMNPANNGQPQNTAMNQENVNHNGQAAARRSAYEHEITVRANHATKALNMLEANGYTQFTNFHRIHSGLFGASVNRNGRWMSVQIDPLDNQIMRG